MKTKISTKKKSSNGIKRIVKRSFSDEIPTNWLDPLLTGKGAVIGQPPYNCKDIERLLTALKDRIKTKEKNCA
jgi:hypothetical protein